MSLFRSKFKAISMYLYDDGMDYYIIIKSPHNAQVTVFASGELVSDGNYLSTQPLATNGVVDQSVLRDLLQTV